MRPAPHPRALFEHRAGWVYDGAMTEPTVSNPVARFLRRLERLMGAHREDRSLWAWVGPVGTVLVTFGALVEFGIVNGVDLPLTLPMALVMSLFLGTLSAFYLTASSADEADARDDDRDTTPRPFPAGDLPADPLGEVAKRDRIAILDRHVAAIEQFEAHVVHTEQHQLVPEGDGAEVEEDLVVATRVDVHRP